MGGTTRRDTCSMIVLLCGSGTTGCHGWVESNRTAARNAGWLVDRWRDPETVPIQHAIYGYVYLLDTGEVVGATTGVIGSGEVPVPLGRPKGEPRPEWDATPPAAASADGW